MHCYYIEAPNKFRISTIQMLVLTTLHYTDHYLIKKGLEVGNFCPDDNCQDLKEMNSI